MNDNCKIRIWGVRGSGPMTAAEYQTYGGNTSCISAECAGVLTVFDAGSGLTALGQYLAGRPDIRQMHLLISHLHLDHIIGLFGFAPLSDPGFTLHIYGSGTNGQGFAQMLSTLYGPPYWPIGLSDLPAAVQIHEIAPGACFTPDGLFGLTGAPAVGSGDGLFVRTMTGNHPGSSLFYRLHIGSRSVACMLDCELTPDVRDAMEDFARDADLLIWDACYTSADFVPGWGHSTWELGADLGRAAGARNVLMTHYNRTYTDTFLYGQEALAAQTDRICRFAKEGAVITL